MPRTEARDLTTETETDRTLTGRALVVAFKPSPGIWAYARALAKALGPETVLVTSLDAREAAATDSVEVIGRSRTQADVFRTSVDPMSRLSIRALLRRYDPTLVWIAGSHPLNVPLLRMIRQRRMRGARTSSVAHIHDPWPHTGNKAGAAVVGVQFIYAHMADKIVVSGESLRDQVRRIYGVSKKKICKLNLPGTDSELDGSKPPNPNERTQFALLGRLEAYKGIDLFIKIAQQYRRTEPSGKFDFLLAGEGSLDAYEKLVSKTSDGLRVRAEYLSDRAFEHELKRSRAVVLPYTEGTQTGIIPQAYSVGTPVVASAVGSIPESVENGTTGYIIAKRDAQAYVEALQHLTDDAHWQQMSYACKRKFSAELLTPSQPDGGQASFVHAV